MKTIVLTLAFFLSVFALKADLPAIHLRVLPQNDEEALIVVSNIGLINLNLEVEDQNGLVVYNQTLDKTYQQTKKINFKQLKEGKYIISLKGRHVELRQNIYYSANYLQLVPEETFALSQAILNPQINLNEQMLTIGFNNLINEVIKVVVLDEAGNVLYQEKATMGENFQKQYDLSKHTRGAYAVNITSNHFNYFTRIERTGIEVSKK